MKKTNKPESQMMGASYDPHLSEGSVKVPIFQTSTFVFKNAEEGKSHFHIAYGLREKNIGESMSLAYSRINNPNLEIAEDRLKLWDNALKISFLKKSFSIENLNTLNASLKDKYGLY